MLKRLSAILLSLTILLLLAGQGWTANYFVNPAATNDTQDGTTWAKAKKTLAGVMAISFSGTNTAYVAPGTYSDQLNFNNAKYAGLSIIGTTLNADPSTYPNGVESVRDTVIVQGGTSAYFNTATPANITLRNLWLNPNNTGRYALRQDVANDGLQLINVRMEPVAGTGYVNLCKISGTNTVLDKVLARSGEVASGTATISFVAGSSGTVQRTIVEPLNADTYRMAGGITSASTGVVNVNASNINGGAGPALNLTAAGTINTYNNKLYGVGPVIKKTAGTVNEDYNELFASYRVPLNNYYTAGITPGAHSKSGPSDIPTASGRGGYIVFCVDDGGAVARDYVISNVNGTGVEDVWKAAGMVGSWFLYASPRGGVIDFDANASDRAMLQGLVQRGTIEVGCHSWSHADVTVAVANFGTLTHTSGTTKQYGIDLAAHTFTFVIDADTFVVNLASDNSDSFQSVLTKVIAHSATWGFTPDAGLFNTYIRVSSLNDTGGLVNTTTKMTFNKSHPDGSAGFYKDEVYDVKTKFTNWVNALGPLTDPQTGATYVCNSFVDPGGAQDATSISAVTGAGYLGDRGGALEEWLNSYHVFSMATCGIANFYGGTDAITTSNVNSLCAQAAEQGIAIFILIHASDAPTTGINSWQTVVNAVKPWRDAGAIQVVSAQQLYTALRAGTYSAGVATRTYSAYTNWNLRGGAPGINAGRTDLGLTTDFAGNKVPNVTGGVSIGAYEYETWGGGITPGLGLGLGNQPGPWRR